MPTTTPSCSSGCSPSASPESQPQGFAHPTAVFEQNSSRTSHKVLALRGYLQFLEGDKKLSQQDKLAKVNDVVPLLERPEEKRLAIAVVLGVGSNEAVAVLGNFAKDQTVSEDAYSAALDLATARRSALTKEQKQQALQMITEKCSNDDLKKRADEALKKL